MSLIFTQNCFTPTIDNLYILYSIIYTKYRKLPVITHYYCCSRGIPVYHAYIDVFLVDSLFVLSLTQITFVVCFLSIELELISTPDIVCLMFFPSLSLALSNVTIRRNVLHIYIQAYNFTRQFINHESNFQFISHEPFDCLADRITFFDCHPQNLIPQSIFCCRNFFYWLFLFMFAPKMNHNFKRNVNENDESTSEVV